MFQSICTLAGKRTSTAWPAVLNDRLSRRGEHDPVFGSLRQALYRIGANAPVSEKERLPGQLRTEAW
jgi:hypothetical protein